MQILQTMGSKLAFSLSLFLTSITAFAYVSVDKLERPSGYQYKEVIDRKSGSLQLVLRNQRKAETGIRFNFNLGAQMLTSRSQIDNDEHLAIPLPGRTLWQPHPGATKSLEGFFIRILRDLSFGGTQHSYLNLHSDGKITYSTVDDFIASARKTAQTTRKCELLEQEIAANVVETKAAIISEILYGSESKAKAKNGWVGRLAERIDPLLAIEPITQEHQNEEEDNRIDAFNLMPIRTFQRYSSAFLDELQKISSAERFSALTWLEESDRSGKAPFSLKLGILALITHNHLNEKLFISKMACELGVKKAWEIYKHINHLYELDRRHYIDNSKSQYDPRLATVYPAPEMFLFERINQYSYPLTASHRQYFLPLKKIYHFYGAMILAARLRALYPHLPDVIIRDFTRFAGGSYKAMTYKRSKKELEIIREIYTAGAERILSYL